METQAAGKLSDNGVCCSQRQRFPFQLVYTSFMKYGMALVMRIAFAS